MTNDKIKNPRQFWLDIATPYGDTCDFIHTEDPHKAAERNKTNYTACATNIHVIELAPMLKMMEEMIDTFDKFSKIRSLPLTDINDSDEEIANQYSSVIDGFIFRSKEIIESYKAFKRENGLE